MVILTYGQNLVRFGNQTVLFDDERPVPPLDTVQIGGIDYHYTKIGNLYWIDVPLRNELSDTSLFGHVDNDAANDETYGLLYRRSAKTAIKELLSAASESGWRIPLEEDFRNLVAAKPSVTDHVRSGYLSESKTQNYKDARPYFIGDTDEACTCYNKLESSNKWYFTGYSSNDYYWNIRICKGLL